MDDAFLATLVMELTSEPIEAIALSGSFTRGMADDYSDVDLVCFVSHPAMCRERLEYRSDRLVSFSYQLLETKFRELKSPRAAIHAVPALRRIRVLLDRDGSLEALRQAAITFRWVLLQPKANSFASETVWHLAEDVHKLLGGLSLNDEVRVLAATLEIFCGLTEAVAVQRGVMVDSGNTYFRQVQESVGVDSAWVQQHRLTAGLESKSSNLSPVLARGVAALALYCETVALLQAFIAPEHHTVIKTVVARIAASGWSCS